MRCRGEGFYHWVQAAKQIVSDDLPPPKPFEDEAKPTQGGDKAKAQEELNLAVAYLDRERDLMKEAGEKGYPAEVAGMGYVPTGYGGAPYQNIRAWAKKKNLIIPSDAELKKLIEKTQVGFE